MVRTTPLARAITHDDLSPKPRGMDLESKVGALLTILCILCGLLCFVLSLFAEATRSQVMWVLKNNKATKGDYECIYSESGKVPLICSAIAFVTLAIAMLIQHSFLLVALSKTETPTILNWEDSGSSFPLKSLTWQAFFFFISTWICFAVGEIMQLIGLSVESGHLTDWSSPRPSCMAIRPGVFTGAGVFSLIAVFLAAGLYATALRVQWLCQEQENARREAIEASVLYASPPTSPQNRLPTAHDSSTNATGQNLTTQTSSALWSVYKAVLDDKQARLV